MDHLSGMAVFAAVVEANSFTAAAQRLGMSKSAVSKNVSRLEDRLGARLMNRTTRRLTLTEVGQAYYERAARIIAEAEEAEAAVSHLQTAPRGILRLNAPHSFGLAHLATPVADFMVRYPEVSVDITLSDRFVDLIDEGIDVAVRIGDMADSSLIARRFAETRRVIAAAPDYWRTHGRPNHPEDLDAHACLAYAYLATGGDWRFVDPDDPEKVISIAAQGPMRANSGDLLLAAAIAGRGVIMLPEFIAGPAIRKGLLEPALENCEQPPIGIHAIYPHSRHLSAKVRAFVDFLVERFSGECDWAA